MSQFVFHFPDQQDLFVNGSERANFSVMTEQYAKGAFGLTYGFGDPYLLEKLGPFINPEGFLGKFLPVDEDEASRRNPAFEQAVGHALNTMNSRNGAPVLCWKGAEINVRQLLLNTVLATGSDALRLAVKINAQCEFHGYIMGFHRNWMADLIKEGLEEGVFHSGRGWEELIVKLREAAQGPVVSSFGKSFPNSDVANWMPPWPEGVEKHWNALTEQQQTERTARQEKWEALSDEKQWKLAVQGLKAPGKIKPWAPDTLRTYRFGHSISLVDLMAHDYDRIEKGLKIA